MGSALLTLRDIHLTFGGTPLLEGAEIIVEPQERLCLVGRNGSGKSTLLKIAAGMISPDKGERFLHPNAVVRYLAQEADFQGFETVLEYVEAGLNPTVPSHQAILILDEFGLKGDQKTATLSGGEARRAAIVRALVCQPDILLLDEPTNHLDLPAIEKLENYLRSVRSALVLISHDRRFLQALSKKTLWIDRGKTRVLNQGFSAFEEWRDDTLEKEERERHKLDRKIVREEQWMHGGVSGRRKRNVRRVRELEDLRQKKRNERRGGTTVNFTLSQSSVSSRLIVEAKKIHKSYEGKTLIKDFSITIMRGDRVGIVGPNGAGKSTLLQVLTGALSPSSGTIRRGESIELIALDQKRTELDPDTPLSHALTGGKGDTITVNGKPRHVASYLKDFLFTSEQFGSPLRVLSGGERGRLMLARILAKPSNVLVLDEPTNDLDLETLDLLQEILSDYQGTVLLVSHDRDFLDRVVTSIVSFENDGLWREYAGGYSDMLAQKKNEKEKTLESTQTKQLKKETFKQTSNTQGSVAIPSKRKLSFKEKHTLETLPSLIQNLTDEIENLQKTLEDPNLYSRDPQKFSLVSTNLAKAQEALLAAEENWIELELLRQTLEM